MRNQELAKIFSNIAIYLEMKDVAFKPQAYDKAAISLETLSDDIENIYKKGGIKALEKISGVGKNIADKIIEYLETGKIKEYQKLKKEIPVDLDELRAVEGIGPKTIRDLYKNLKIKNLKDLEKAILAGKIRSLPNFGLKSEQNILESIEFVKRSRGRFLLGEIWPTVKEIENKLKRLKEVEKISICGSLRRKKETIGDVDLLAVSKNPVQVMNFFVSLPGVAKIWGKGTTKSSVRMKKGFDMDIRVVPQKSYGASLQYFTGSKEHNIVLRKIAIDKKMKLNEYGLFKSQKSNLKNQKDNLKLKNKEIYVAGKTEKDIYKNLGLQYVEPEIRENQGEIELAQKNKLPKIIDTKDITGDLHCHSDWDGGSNSIEEIAKAAMARNYQYVGISDHTKFLAIEHGLNEKQLIQRNKEIDKLNTKYKIQNTKFKILKGCEANILADGSIDIKDEVLAKLDYVIAGVHSQFKMPKERMTERIVKAMRNPNVDIISHPTGRLIQRRDGYLIDFDKILKTAKETGTILEINAHPIRLDLNDKNILKAKKAGVKMIINSDSHHIDQMSLMEYGVGQARRGWAEKKDVVNTWPLERLIKLFEK